ncbi:MAG: recombinase family protein, partial [Patescibacteria group bacterium]|nr:recombinase family protein [Patescibacteria group bacterium]
NSMPQATRPVDRKTIELVLRNRFYLGEMKVISGEWRRSEVHQALIDTELFNKVQRVMKTRTLTVRYEGETFYPYRDLIRCSCGRLYSPYTKKGIIYYRSRCTESCENCDPNLNETEIDTAVQGIMDGVSFSAEELRDIESRTKSQIEEISVQRDRELGDLHARQQKLVADLGYVSENRITLLRTGAMTADEIRAEVERLNGSIAAVQSDIRAHGESAKDMLRYVLTFSELAHNASQYFRHALDNEKRDLVAQMVTELVFENRRLKSYKARDGYASLLERNKNGNSGAQERT